MRNCRTIMRRSRVLLLSFAITGLLAGCTSKTLDNPLSLPTPTPPTPDTIYSLRFDANGGSVSTGVFIQRIRNGASLPTPIRTREGRWDFTFAYWSADKRTRFEFDTPATGITTLYALWSVSIPDTNFRNKLKTIVPSAFDGDRLVVSHASVTGLTSMDVLQSSISDLSGIEFFTDLTRLGCGANQLTELDVTRNTDLTVLACYDNQLEVLDVTRNTDLTTLSCYKNRLAALDVTRNTDLTLLACYENQLTELDVTRNTALTLLNCHNNQLTTLDVTRNTALLTLICGENLLTELDVRNNIALTLLNCIGNQLTTLDVTQNVALTELGCNVNRLTTLDVTQNTALTRLGCNSNQLASLDLSRNTALTELYCADNQVLTTLDMRGMRSVSSSSSTPSLDLSENPNLISLKVHSNLKDRSEVYGLKNTRGTSLAIEVSDAPAGSINYTKTCSSYQPGNGAAGTCLTP